MRCRRIACSIGIRLYAWRTGNYNQNKGILFKAPDSVENGTAHNRKLFFSSYNRSSYKPSLSVTYSTTSNLISDGTYYLNNRYSGNYLRYASSAATASSGLISNLGDSIRWEIRAVNGGYMIRAKADSTKYLGVPTDTNNGAVSIVTVSDSAIPTRCIWTATVASGGGCYIKNTYNSRYLSSENGSLYTTGYSGVNSAGYDTGVWRIASTSYYGSTDATPRRELSSYTTIENIEGRKDTNATVKVNPSNDELWISPSDFTYMIENPSIASYSDGRIKLEELGGTKIEATHKVTNRVKTFYVLVGFSTTITETPLSDSIISGLNQPHDVWPASEESIYYTYSTLDRGNALRQIRERALLTMTVGWIAQNPDAAKMLNHFLNNTGTLYTVDMKQMIEEWGLAQESRVRDMNYVMQAVEASASYGKQTIRTIAAFDCPHSESSNWGRAVGQYSTSITCTYQKTATNTYKMQVIYELHDVYDWDPEVWSMGNLPVSPREMWELHHGGMAKNYEVYGKNTFTVTWTKGQTFETGAVMSNET